MKKIIELLPIIKDIAIILVCVLILVASIHKNSSGSYIALPITSKFFSADTNIFDSSISGDMDISTSYKNPLYIRIVK